MGIHEALQVTLAFDELAHGCGVMISLTDKLYQRAPVAVESRAAITDAQVCGTNGCNLPVLVTEVAIVLQPHVVVRNDQREQLALYAADGQHAVVVEQADEIVIVHDPLSREMADKNALDITFLRDLVDDAEAILFHVVDLYEPLQLAVVRHRVGINHYLRAFACINELTHVIANHIAVEHAGLDSKTVIGEAVVVVPRLHVRDDVVLSLVLTYGPNLFVVADHLPHLFLREAEHLVEAGVKTHVQRDVVTTREIVECNRRDTKHDDAVEHRLEKLEDVAVEAGAVGELMVSLLSFHVEYVVGEVVVLVNNEVEFVPSLLCLHPDYVELACSSLLSMHPLNDVGTIVVLIVVDERVHHIAAVTVEILV